MTKHESPQSTRKLLLGIWGHLSRRRRIQFGFLLLVMLFSAIAELVSLGAVVPFLAILSDPQLLWEDPMAQRLILNLGITKVDNLLIPASLLFASAAVIAALIRLVNIWLNSRLAAAVGSDLSCVAYERTLRQPYMVHVQRDSSTVIAVATAQISRTVTALSSLLQMITAGIISAGLLCGLFLIDWGSAIGAILLFGTVYIFLALASRRELLRNSKLIAISTKHQIKALQEGLGAIRDVILDSNQLTYVDIYRQADRQQRQLTAKNQFLGAFPRYVVEALGLVAIAFLGVVLVLQQGSEGSAVPLLGAMALGAQRLLPVSQQIYGSWSSIKGYNSDIAGVLALLDQPLFPQVNTAKPLSFRSSICFKGVHFTYGSEKSEVLRGIDLDIHIGERIGLIGNSGSGKTTLTDILMGLLAPTSGQVLIDGVDLNDFSQPDRLAAWRSAVSHVPQNVYLANTSIAENIAFGLPYQEIDMARVKFAAEQAQISSFIESSKDGYRSFVGERGVSLSGGQRQRIGIARALYKQSKILVFDEATSSLDSATETAVMESIDDLSQDLTIVLIAHRLTTLQNCDRIIKLDAGTVI